jgi:hypothetical protein
MWGARQLRLSARNTKTAIPTSAFLHRVELPNLISRAIREV